MTENKDPADISVEEYPITETETLFKKTHHYANGDVVEIQLRQLHMDTLGKPAFTHSIFVGSETARLIAQKIMELTDPGMDQ